VRVAFHHHRSVSSLAILFLVLGCRVPVKVFCETKSKDCRRPSITVKVFAQLNPSTHPSIVHKYIRTYLCDVQRAEKKKTIFAEARSAEKMCSFVVRCKLKCHHVMESYYSVFVKRLPRGWWTCANQLTAYLLIIAAPTHLRMLPVVVETEKK